MQTKLCNGWDPRFDLHIVPREEWAEGPRKSLPPFTKAVKYVVMTYNTPAPRCYNKEECVKSMRELYKYYVEKMEMEDIPFNFLVSHDGTVYEARGFVAQPCGFLPYFREHVGNRFDIAFIGDYELELYPDVMMSTTMAIVNMGVDKDVIRKFHDALEYRDEKRTLQAVAAVKENSPWENWQLQYIAEKVYGEKLEYRECQKRLKHLIPKKNMPVGDLCVIM
ncbi:peptidoglycan-recognition protein SB1-like [Macrosteles quadrilineatus]|uniref:peptidoglycan-recognition protein SB1-like n=1 Tax=Macrosteles quadrilineatus TaxID=74068 RepID=UPI0023E1EE64|nr:peptidoglycan-recognition protein SB1-like [Macrosteles quadrilineatus]